MHDVNDQHGFEPGEWDSDHPLAAEAQRMLLRALSSREQAFGSFFLSRLFGFEISYGADTCTVRFMADATKGNPQGSLHGGVIATAMDISMGHLLRHHRGPGTTLEMKVQYLSAVRTGPVAAEARFLRQGRSVCFLQSTLFDAEGDIVALATSTWKLLNRTTT